MREKTDVKKEINQDPQLMALLEDELCFGTTHSLLLLRNKHKNKKNILP